MRIRRNVIAAVITVGVLLGGCSNTELEERNFPLAAAISPADNGYEMVLGFQQLSDVADENATKENSTGIIIKGSDSYELFEAADRDRPGKIDYNHMKAMILNPKLLEDEEKAAKLFDYMEKQNLIPRNTLLYVCDDPLEDIISMNHTLDEPVGTYLDKLTGSDMNQKDSAAVTLGSLFCAQKNRNENLYIPYLQVEDKTMQLTGYYVMQGFYPKKVISRELGELALLTEGKVNRYSIHMEDGKTVELSDFDCTYDFTVDGDTIQETVTIQMDGKVSHAAIENDIQQKKTEQETEQRLERLLNDAAGAMKEEQDVDISNSFYRLGGYDRDAYETYEDEWRSYRQHLQIQYDCQVTALNF